MEYILHNDKVCFYYDGVDNERYGRLEVFDHVLAFHVNKRLKKYNNGKYRFKVGDEPFFRVPLNQIQSILSDFMIRESKII